MRGLPKRTSPGGNRGSEGISGGGPLLTLEYTDLGGETTAADIDSFNAQGFSGQQREDVARQANGERIAA